MYLHGQIMNISGEESSSALMPRPSKDEASAYLLGHRDARHAAAELAIKADAQIEHMARALRGLLANCEFRSIGGDSAAWHMKSMPRDGALTEAREALLALERG